MVMMVLAGAMNASITWVRTSVHTWSLRNPRVRHELVRSITQRRPACKGVPLAEIWASQPSISSSSRRAPARRSISKVEAPPRGRSKELEFVSQGCPMVVSCS